jgi:hypothetical protein
MYADQKKPGSAVEEEILAVVEGDAQCWLDAAQHCETFSDGLPEQDKVIANLLSAVYRERAKIHKVLAAKLRQRFSNGARETTTFHEIRTGCATLW